MEALYDLFRTPTPQKEGEKETRYHARSIVTGKMTTRDLAQAIGKRSAFKEPVVTGVLIARDTQRSLERRKERADRWHWHLPHQCQVALRERPKGDTCREHRFQGSAV